MIDLSIPTDAILRHARKLSSLHVLSRVIYTSVICIQGSGGNLDQPGRGPSRARRGSFQCSGIFLHENHMQFHNKISASDSTIISTHIVLK